MSMRCYRTALELLQFPYSRGTTSSKPGSNRGLGFGWFLIGFTMLNSKDKSPISMPLWNLHAV